MKNQIMENANKEFEKSTSLVIKINNDRQKATDLWDIIRSLRKDAERQKEEACRPLKQAWDDEKKSYDNFIHECKNHEQSLQNKMSQWDRETKRLSDAEAARQWALIEKENKKIQKMCDKLNTDQVLKVAPIVPTTPKSMEAYSGKKQTSTIIKFYEPTDIQSLMKDFPQIFDVNHAKFNALGRAGLLDGRSDVKISEKYIYRQV